jgi:hypothetical protein
MPTLSPTPNIVICEEFRNRGSNEGPLDQRGPKPRPDKCGDGASTRTHKTMEREREQLAQADQL